MRRIRIAYFLILLGLLLGGLYTGRRDIFIVFAVFLLVVPFALGLNLLTFYTLKFEQGFAVPKVIRGEKSKYILRVVNNKPFAFRGLKLHVELLPHMESKVVNVELAPRYQAEYEFELDCEHRGIFRAGVVSVEVTDIFGIFHIKYNQMKRRFYLLPKLKVYPRLVSLPHSNRFEDDLRYRTLLTNDIEEHGDAFAALREYRSGDVMKRIHWPTTAKKKEVFVKIYDALAEASILMLIDNSYAGYEGEDLLSYADTTCEAVAALAEVTGRIGYSTLVSEMDSVAFNVWSSRYKAMPELLEMLTRMPFDRQIDPFTSLKSLLFSYKNIDTVILVTSRNYAGFERNIAKLVPKETRLVILFVESAQSEKLPPPTANVARYVIPLGEDISPTLGGLL